MLNEKQSSETAVIEPLASDERLIEVWLYGRPSHTVRAYRSDIERFRDRAGKPLPTITLPDLQDFAASLIELAPATQYRILSSVKSLLAFGHRLGYLTVDAGRAVRLPPVKMLKLSVSFVAICSVENIVT